jgi:hypothetical protein
MGTALQAGIPTLQTGLTQSTMLGFHFCFCPPMARQPTNYPALLGIVMKLRE